MISINVNSAASASGLNLGKTNDALQKSLQRLSSGTRIVNSSDDAGGLAVSMKMSAALKRTEATSTNLANTLSFLQTQDGAFKVADKVLNRMSELSALAADVTKNPTDVENYWLEFRNLQGQLTDLASEKFNSVPLFSAAGDTLIVSTSEDGKQTLSITQAAIADEVSMSAIINMSEAQFSSQVAADKQDNSAALQLSIQSLASMRAQNGSESSRIQFSQDLLKINAINLEAANSRIIDVDVAAESSQLARFQILQQAGTAMLAQANTSQQSLVRLLQGG